MATFRIRPGLRKSDPKPNSNRSLAVRCGARWEHLLLKQQLIVLRRFLTAAELTTRLVEAQQQGAVRVLNPLFVNLPSESFADAVEKSGVSPTTLGSGYAAFFIYFCLIGLVAVALAVIVMRGERAP